MNRLWLCIFFITNLYASESIHVAVSAEQYQKMPVLIGAIGDVDEAFKEVLATCKKDFEMTGQCLVTVKKFEAIQKKSQIKKLFEEGFYIAVFLSQESQGFSWRLYDTSQASMIAGKKYKKQGHIVRGWGHALADAIWPLCMGSKSSFSSKLAYCIQKIVTRGGKKKVQKHIYIADSDGSHARPFVTVPTVCLAPRWNKDVYAPILFYSENTVSNVRLVMSNMFGKRKTICSFDGLNMLPTFSDDGKHIVFCLSKDGTSQLYHSYIKSGKRVYERLTYNEGQNISPCFIDNNTIAFVSDYKTKHPQIYTMNLLTKNIEQITEAGYCACPDYCKVNNKLLYSKMLAGGMQIFVYDFATKKHEQLTKGYESKEEGCWSPCGNFIIFAARHGLQSRIARFNLVTGRMHYITPTSMNCTYPAWSPVYQEFIA